MRVYQEVYTRLCTPGYTMVGIVLSSTPGYTMVGIGLSPILPGYTMVGIYLPVHTTPLYTPGYTLLHRCTHGAGRYVYPAVMMRREEALGSEEKKPLGGGLFPS